MTGLSVPLSVPGMILAAAKRLSVPCVWADNSYGRVGRSVACKDSPESGWQRYPALFPQGFARVNAVQ